MEISIAIMIITIFFLVLKVYFDKKEKEHLLDKLFTYEKSISIYMKNISHLENKLRQTSNDLNIANTYLSFKDNKYLKLDIEFKRQQTISNFYRKKYFSLLKKYTNLNKSSNDKINQNNKNNIKHIMFE